MLELRYIWEKINIYPFKEKVLQCRYLKTVFDPETHVVVCPSFPDWTEWENVPVVDLEIEMITEEK